MAEHTEDIKLPYYCFGEGEYEGRYWNLQGKGMAIVAIVTENVDWAAYIGTDAPNSWHEKDTLRWVAKYGAKLSEKDARYFFPEIKLSYRY